MWMVWWENFIRWIAWHTPREVCYWIGIRMWTEVSMADGYEMRELCSLTCEEVLHNWSPQKTIHDPEADCFEAIEDEGGFDEEDGWEGPMGDRGSSGPCGRG